MWVMDEGLAPGVEDGEEADLVAEMARIGGDRAEHLGDGAEEETVDDGLVLSGDLGDRRGHGEDDVEVLGGQQVRPAPFEPRGTGTAALAELRTLQAEYKNWRDQLPEPLVDSRTAELLDEVCHVDLDALDLDLPRGFGRD